ncbi:hypothetical protein [Streptomyces sp. N35]|uniref:hypothetical protein n=1 Tax=Streptomyces sp. N35 TaxID=2795730 RepID=UPI0018F4B254
MRRTRRYGPLLAGLSLLLFLPSGTAPTPAAAEPAPPGRPFGSACRTAVEGGRGTAYCHNPYPPADHVRLHIECDRWWDIDSDAVAVAAEPALTVRLTGRCWKEVRSAWVSHNPVP